jgi:hypothetical protein
MMTGESGIADTAGDAGSPPQYASGGGVAIVHGGTWLFAPTIPTAQVVERCWQAVRAGADTDQVVSAILHDGFRAVPDFALVNIGTDAAHVVVRGAAAVDIVYADGTRSTIDTGNTASLIEHAVTGVVAALRLRGREAASVDADAIVDAAQMLPLESGVVLASMLGFGTFAAQAPSEEPVKQVAEAVSRSHAAPISEPALTSEPTAKSEAAPVRTVQSDQGEQVPDLDYIFSTTSVRAAPTGLLDDAMDWMPVQERVSQVDAQPVIDAFEPAPAPASAILVGVAIAEKAEPVAVFDSAGADAEATVFRPAARVAAADQPVVQAVRCPAGHLNDPAAIVCRACRQRISAQQPLLTPRPSLGRLRLSNGELLSLDRGVIFGRNPELPEGYAGPRVSLIRLSTAEDISRNHVEILLDGWRVLVVDLGSRNGTELTRALDQPGQSLQALQQYELEPGMVVSLAPDVWIAYEVTP